MAEIDSLEIKISAESKDAESSLDRIIQKIESLGQLTKANNNLPKVLSGLSSNVSTNGIDKATDSLKNLSEKSTSAAENIRQNCSKIADAVDSIGQKLSSDIKTPTIDFGNDNYRKTIQESADVTKQSAERIKESVQNVSESYEKANEEQSKFANFSFGKLATDAAVLSGAIDKIGEKLSKLGDLGQKALGFMYIPLKGVVNEYKEKLEAIKGHFDEFFKKVKTGLTKLSAFWKRAMRTFTFMILRKAFTQIIKDIGEATESLALFSKEFGTTFNENISNAIADFKWIGKAIVGAFEPIINYVVPVLNVLSVALVKVITLLGHFFAALTGQGYYMVAKKKVDDYADSLKKAAKEAKKSIRPFDELNLITSGNKSDTDTGLNPAEDWDMKPVSDKMKKLADKIKDIARQLFEPIKKAWDRTKDYVISGFKYMVSELGKLFKSIGRDFLEVWRQEATVKIFENIFKIVGDIERVIGNLAKRFREAWDEGEKGLHIFENIRDIIGILIQHVRNVTEYMVEWSDSIDFNPLLEGVERLTGALKKVADFIGGVFEDVMKNVVLEYIKWLIEEGTPHLLETISEIIDAFDFDKIREDLVPVEKAFEKLLENIHTGVTNAIGVLGKALADWMNSENFTKFMESLAHIMQQITAERVEKVLEALGLAILEIAEAVADFVSSDKFLNFIDKIGEWIDSKSAEDLAGYVKGIIELTAAFKGLGVVLPIVSKLLKTATMLKAVGDIGKIAKGLSTAGTATKGAGKVIKFGSQEKVLGEMSGILTKIQSGFGKVAQSASSTASKISSAFASINWGTVLTGDIGSNLAAGGATAGATIGAAIIGGIAAAIGGWNLGQLIDKKLNGDEGMGSFLEQMKGIKDAFTDGSWKDALDLWGQDLSQGWKDIGEEIKSSDFGEWVGEKWQGLSEKAGQLKEDVSGAFSLMGQDIEEKFSPVSERVSKIFEGLGIIIKAVWQTVVEWFGTNVIQPIVEHFRKLWAAIKSIWNAVSTWFKGNVVEPIKEFFKGLWEDVKGFFEQLWVDIEAVWSAVSEWFNTNVVEPVVGFFRQAWEDIKGFFTSLWEDIKGVWNAVYGWFDENIFQPLSKGFSIVVEAVKGFFKGLWEDIKSGVKSAFNSVISTIEGAVNGIIDGVNKFFELFNKGVSLAAKITGDTEKWGGGVQLIPKVKLPRFASGGFPEDGTFFRASHGELMGQFDNGKSVVANNQQIVDGIKAGVFDAMMQAIPSLAQAVSNDTTVVVEGDMNKMFRAMVKENYGANKRTFNASPLYS